jgi:cytochrome c6
MVRGSSSATKLAIGLMILAAVVFSARPVRADAAAGEKVYKSKCLMCHGADGAGTTAAGKSMGAHDLRSAAVQKMTDAEMTEIIAKGKNKMPGYAVTFKGNEIKDLVAYIRTLAPKK